MQSLVDYEKSRKFHTIDGLRGIAAVAVVALHYSEFLSPFAMRGAYLAVDLFFIISGFIIAYNYEPKFRAGLSPLTFTRKRYVRLFPMYAIGVLARTVAVVTSLALHLRSDWTWSILLVTIVPALFILPGPRVGFSDGLFILNDPAWSLFWEMAINIAFAFAFAWISKKTLLVLLPVSGLALVATATHLGSLSFGFSWGTAYAGLARVCFSFPLGVLLCRLWRSGALPRIKVPPFLVMAALALVLWIPTGPSVRPVFDLACVFIAFPVLVVLALENEPRRPALYTALGLISYPLYAIHVPVRVVLTMLVAHIPGAKVGHREMLICLLFIAGLAGLCWVLATMVDGRLQKMLDSALRRLGAIVRR